MSTAILKKAKGPDEAKPNQLIQCKIGKGQMENDTNEQVAMHVLEKSQCKTIHYTYTSRILVEGKSPVCM